MRTCASRWTLCGSCLRRGRSILRVWSRLWTSTPPIVLSPQGRNASGRKLCCPRQRAAALRPASTHPALALTLQSASRPSSIASVAGPTVDVMAGSASVFESGAGGYLYSTRAETFRPGVQSSYRRGKGRRRFFLRGPRDVTEVQPSRFLIRRNRKVSHLRPPQHPISRTAGASAFGQSALGADSSN